jgi:hypothetical protein
MQFPEQTVLAAFLEVALSIDECEPTFALLLPQNCGA